MQAYSPILPVGTQHYYKSSFDALATVFRTDKFWGLLRDVDAAILQTAMASSVQLPTYKINSSVSGICMVFFCSYQVTNNRRILTPRSALSCIVQPADTALTRVYNKPTCTPDGRLAGTLYRNPIDCP
ncbi:uncharacterized protein BJ212DRAFT_1368041 [Suillus subaureus]|uniref:Uncharacterized protein n=1 Tax=Suillus subaureus TaxID=48587 RepID=A0A9P7E7V4_9AGAM|nr:uncharacterized protein BJ212DRAFT_1368041 [Suillus subaureus]KAG1813359.1 hypothetical protein BJ212DRAFT_1368041 [Suillus subaureus]